MRCQVVGKCFCGIESGNEMGKNRGINELVKRVDEGEVGVYDLRETSRGVGYWSWWEVEFESESERLV